MYSLWQNLNPSCQYILFQNKSLRILKMPERGELKVSESECVRIPIFDNFVPILKVSESECVRIWMCQNLLWPKGVRNLKSQTWMCQNWIVSELYQTGNVRIILILKVSESECVRTGRCKNFQEPKSIRIFKILKVSESEGVRTRRCQKILNSESEGLTF